MTSNGLAVSHSAVCCALRHLAGLTHDLAATRFVGPRPLKLSWRRCVVFGCAFCLSLLHRLCMVSSQPFNSNETRNCRNELRTLRLSPTGASSQPEPRSAEPRHSLCPCSMGGDCFANWFHIFEISVFPKFEIIFCDFVHRKSKKSKCGKSKRVFLHLLFFVIFVSCFFFESPSLWIVWKYVFKDLWLVPLDPPRSSILHAVKLDGLDFRGGFCAASECRWVGVDLREEVEKGGFSGPGPTKPNVWLGRGAANNHQLPGRQHTTLCVGPGEVCTFRSHFHGACILPA